MVEEDFEASCLEALPLLAHELVHVTQFLTTKFFRLKYLGEYVRLRREGLGGEAAYANISFEVEARRMEADVEREIREAGSSCECAGCCRETLRE